MKASIPSSSLPGEGIKLQGNHSSSMPLSWLAKINKNLGTRLIPSLSVVAGISTLLVGASAWNTWNVYRTFQQTITRNFRLQELSGDIVHIDEVLTMSARMAASTADTSWQKRYDDFVPKLDDAIKTVLEMAPEYQVDAEQTDAANLKLVAMEEKAFSLVRNNRSAEALKLLLGPEYKQQKELYSQGINATLNNIRNAINGQLQNYSGQLVRSALFASLSLPILVFSWSAVILLVRSYMKERRNNQEALEKLNTELQQQLEQLDQQEQSIRRESEVLQGDVEQLLDAVSAVEAGDLTKKVPVNSRVTGLVADTLNRLTEELAQVIVEVLKAAQEVSLGAKALEEAAQAVASNADQQARGVTQVLHLTEQVERSAQASSQQIQTSTNSLLAVRTTIESGRDSITSLTEGIDVLQQGTVQIVQQMKTLGEFVGITDQFVQEQRQIASLTQVLAVNASLVAARASEQRDPTQFVVVAREFESIANQVSSLAQRTSEGLVNLEQRSTQIHTVVSAVDTNVQNLGGLVEGFTEGVEKSDEVFGNIRVVASDAAQAGETVSQSSHQILGAAQSTAQVMREIANLANRTVKLSQQTSRQSDRMEKLSTELLDNIQFFNLSQELLAQTTEASSEIEALPPVETVETAVSS